MAFSQGQCELQMLLPKAVLSLLVISLLEMHVHTQMACIWAINILSQGHIQVAMHVLEICYTADC